MNKDVRACVCIGDERRDGSEASEAAARGNAETQTRDFDAPSRVSLTVVLTVGGTPAELALLSLGRDGARRALARVSARGTRVDAVRDE